MTKAHAAIQLAAAALALTFVSASCSRGLPARTPECNAIVNRCMDQCANRPEALTPRNTAVDDGQRAVPRGGGCEQSCANKC